MKAETGRTARTKIEEQIQMSIPVAPTPVRIAGRLHLVYELHLTNPRADSVVITRIRLHPPLRGGD